MCRKELEAKRERHAGIRQRWDYDLREAKTHPGVDEVGRPGTAEAGRSRDGGAEVKHGIKGRHLRLDGCGQRRDRVAGGQFGLQGRRVGAGHQALDLFAEEVRRHRALNGKAAGPLRRR